MSQCVIIYSVFNIKECSIGFYFETSNLTCVAFNPTCITCSITLCTSCSPVNYFRAQLVLHFYDWTIIMEFDWVAGIIGYTISVTSGQSNLSRFSPRVLDNPSNSIVPDQNNFGLLDNSSFEGSPADLATSFNTLIRVGRFCGDTVGFNMGKGIFM